MWSTVKLLAIVLISSAKIKEPTLECYSSILDFRDDFDVDAISMTMLSTIDDLDSVYIALFHRVKFTDMGTPPSSLSYIVDSDKTYLMKKIKLL